MRVTNRTIVQDSIQRLGERQQALDAARARISSGQRIQRASEDPAGANRILALRADQRAREQEVRNAEDARTWVDLADDALQGASTALRRVRDLVTQGANPLSPQAREALATQLESLRDELRSTANTQREGKPLFAGFGTGQAVTGGPGAWTYAGDTAAIQRRVGPQDVVTVNVHASDVFGFAAGDDVFSMLDELAASMRAGDQAALSAGIGRVDAAIGRVGDGLATVGAAGRRVETAVERARDAVLAIRGELAAVQDIDVAETVMELQLQELAYQATLGALARALPPSLVSFLR